jgi:hypothetical protein
VVIIFTKTTRPGPHFKHKDVTGHKGGNPVDSIVCDLLNITELTRLSRGSFLIYQETAQMRLLDIDVSNRQLTTHSLILNTFALL